MTSIGEVPALAPHESQDRLGTLLNNFPGMACRCRNNFDRTLEFASDGCIDLTGYAPCELVGSRRVAYGQIIDRQDRRAVWDQIQAALRARRRFEITYRIVAADGETKWVCERGHGIIDERGQVTTVEGFIVDITENKRAEQERASLEAQLRQAHKLEAIGTLAGGVAHDFNNILTVILAYNDLADMDTATSEELRQYHGQVRQAGHRARDLVRQILAFGRPSKNERKPLRLQPIIKEALKLLRSTLPATIEMDLHIDDKAPLALADATQIHQVLVNLCTNASHAMQGKPGRLAVSFESWLVDPGFGRSVPDLDPGPYSRLTVRDTGEGIDPETLKHIFEPFFTTKSPGEGTGLGLAVVQGIVREHEGAIAVHSRPGVGTTFEIYFPAVRVELPELRTSKADPPRGRGEQILVVDDESAICTSMKMILGHLGYRVVAHTVPLEALCSFRENADQFEMVITDLTMPRMTGVELARRVMQLRPGLPVLLMSGFAGTLTGERARALGICGLLTKPIDLPTLAAAVRATLDGRPIEGEQEN